MASVNNLILNPSLKTQGEIGSPANWHPGGYGNNDRQLTYPVAGFDDAFGASVAINTYTDGDAKWYFDDVNVTPGVTYNYSNYYKSNVQTSVAVQYTLTDNTFAYQQIGTLGASSNWLQFNGSFTAPANAKSVTVFHILSTVGTLTVDMFSLSAASTGSATQFDKGYVTLSFDDGWTSAHRTVKPILDNAAVKGTFYVMSTEAQNASESDYNDANSYLTYAKLKELQNAGHEVTAHTRTHVSLIGLSDAQAQSEINGSRNDLIGQGFTPVETFAYPFGDYDSTAIQRVKDAGFKGARSVDGGYNMKNSDKFTLKVQNVLMGTTAAQMKAWIDKAVADKTWLNIVFHQVDNMSHDPNEEDYSTTPAILQDVVNYLKNNNISVITTQQGIQMMP